MEIELKQSANNQEVLLTQKDQENSFQQNNDQDIAIEIQDEKSDKLSQQVNDKDKVTKNGKPKKKYYQKFMSQIGKQQKKEIFLQEDWDRVVYQKQEYHEISAFIKLHKKEYYIEYETIEQDYDVDIDLQDDEDDDNEDNNTKISQQNKIVDDNNDQLQNENFQEESINCN